MNTAADPSISVLVVEDERIIAKGIEKRLKGLGYGVAGLASNGTEAVQQALKIGPDIILMDINLGQGIDGVEAAGLIRRDVDIPVVYLTAHSDDATLQRAKVSEPYGYVLKPYEDSDLQTAIEIGLYRHLMEARLRENEAWLTATLSSIGDGVIACDDQGQIRFMNSLAEQLTGWTQKEAIGRTLRDVFRTVSAEDHKPLANPALEALRKGEDTLLSSSVILIDRNESQCHIENEASPIRDSQGRITGSVLVFRDVTERRRMEENLRQAQKMEAIGRLAGGIAHDFNNIMTVIIGFSDYLLNEETFPPDKKDVVQKIHDAGTRAAALTQQIMAFSRKQILAPEVLCLNSIIRELEPMIRRLIGANIELITQLDLKVGSIRADRSQMEQVIVNLAANARDAMPSGGRLTISTVNHEDVLTDTDQSDCVARMTIEDNGTGIPDDILEHAFEPFFTTKEGGRGTGLGLATVYGIVQQSDGQIRIDSNVGKGTTVCVDLPLVDAQVTPVSQVEAVASVPGHENILLVEDEDPVRRMTKMALERCGYSVLEAINGERALEIAAASDVSIDLLLTDLVMPLMSGREVAEKLTQQIPELSVLFMSGYTDDEEIHRNIETASTDFLQKPFLLVDLQQKIRDVLDRQ